MVCPNCHRNIIDGSNLCPYCHFVLNPSTKQIGNQNTNNVSNVNNVISNPQSIKFNTISSSGQIIEQGNPIEKKEPVVESQNIINQETNINNEVLKTKATSKKNILKSKEQLFFLSIVIIGGILLIVLLIKIFIPRTTVKNNNHTTTTSQTTSAINSSGELLGEMSSYNFPLSIGKKTVSSIKINNEYKKILIKAERQLSNEEIADLSINYSDELVPGFSWYGIETIIYFDNIKEFIFSDLTPDMEVKIMTFKGWDYINYEQHNYIPIVKKFYNKIEGSNNYYLKVLYQVPDNYENYSICFGNVDGDYGCFLNK